MSSRFLPRVAIVARALLRRLAGGRRSGAGGAAGRILIAHHLLLGDTLMLTPLLAKLRARYPQADIAMAVPEPCAPLYANRPYGVRALGWNPRDARSVRRLLAEPGFDLALIPGDNRHSWLAQAMGARWIVAFAGDRPPYKSWLVDELRAYPDVPGAWFDITATLVDGDAPAAYLASDWAPPAAAPFELPHAPYCVLHVGASARLKLWEPERWNALAAHLRVGGWRIAWSAGPGEEALVEACAPEPGDLRTSGRLDLAQLWRLLHNASLLVCPGHRRRASGQTDRRRTHRRAVRSRIGPAARPRRVLAGQPPIPGAERRRFSMPRPERPVQARDPVGAHLQTQPAPNARRRAACRAFPSHRCWRRCRARGRSAPLL